MATWYNLVQPDDDYDDANEMTIKKFAGILSMQLIYKAYNYHGDYNVEEEELMREPFNPERQAAKSNSDVRINYCDDDFGAGKGTACFVTLRSTPCENYSVC